MADRDHDLLAELNKKTYPAQAKWFLNTLWNERFADSVDAREQIWTFAHNMIAMDKLGARGSGLPEMQAHIFLEKNTDSQTWTAFRDKMREIGFEHKNVTLLTFLIFTFQLDHHKLVNAKSGVLDADSEAQLAAAQDKLDAAQDALDAAVAAKAEADDSAKAAAAALKTQQEAEAEVKAGLEAIQAEETKKANTIAKLKKRSENEKLGTVKRGKAFQEWKKLEGEDPLPLRKAKIDQGAKVRKMKRATKACKKAQTRAEKAAAAAAKAVEDAQSALEAAEVFLAEVKASSKGATNDGILWWMERELAEKRKYLPRGKAAALERKVKRKMKKLRKNKANAKRASAKVTAADSSKLIMSIGGKQPQLKPTETRGEGVSDAVKAAFVADAKNEPIEEDDDDEEEEDTATTAE